MDPGSYATDIDPWDAYYAHDTAPMRGWHFSWAHGGFPISVLVHTNPDI